MTGGNEAINWLQRGHRSCSQRSQGQTYHYTVILPRLGFDRFKRVNMYPKSLAGSDLNSVDLSVANAVDCRCWELFWFDIS